MKRVLAVALILSVFLTGCVSSAVNPESVIAETHEKPSEADDVSEDISTELDFSEKNVDPDNLGSLSQPEAQQYIEDCVYATLEEELGSEDYEVVNVNATYVSQEYIDELAYNSQSNIYFGYTLDEIEAQLGDQPYIFTVDEEGNTVVKVAEPYDDTFDTIVRNVAVGTGVILVCVTVAVVSGGALAVAGAGAPAALQLVNTVFVFAAEESVTYALLGGAISGVTTGLVTGCQTGDFDQAVNAGLLAASEGYMWGAITGAVVGGAEGAIEYSWMKSATSSGIPTWQESEKDIAQALNADEQVSFLGGEEVPWGTSGATRPDGVIYDENGVLTAIEVKNYDLENNLYNLGNELERQIGQRTVDLPAGSLQEIYLDVRGRGYSMEFLDGTVGPYLTEVLSDVYPNIPIYFYGA